jgi:hypothetical protein
MPTNKSTFSNAILCAWCGQEVEIPDETISSLSSTWSAGLCPTCEEEIASGDVSWPKPMEAEQ